MKFSEIKYTRPDFEKLKSEFENYLNRLDQSNDFDDQINLIKSINKLRDEFGSLSSLVHVRHSINTADELYEKEHDFFNEKGPEFGALTNQFYKWLNTCKNKNELINTFGSHLFNSIEVSLKTFKQEIIEDLQKENQLKSEYGKLIASAKISFRGEVYNLSSIGPHTQNQDRSYRKEAVDALYTWLNSNADKFDDLYDKLVKIRTEIANKLGFENFVQLGYYRLGRTDYNAADVKDYREKIKKHVVPFIKKLKDAQKKRLGIDKIAYYDVAVKFPDGNPQPQGDPDWIIEQGKTMYKELSEETHEFFQFMIENDAMDLVSKDNKMAGGYCTYMPAYELPFIFSNFNGTSHDIDVLTHEAGHAFQIYNSRSMEVPEYYWPTLEACEIHSMSMEFFTWPWMESFFKHQTSKYKFNHVTGGLTFLPYGAAVDEFQHVVYENPNFTPEERNAAWSRIEKEYGINEDAESSDYLKTGRFWQKQGHIYSSPFYYIDYTLAQIVAYQYWAWSQKDFNSAWDSYVNLCKLGGSLPFTELVKSTGLKLPFNTDALEEVVMKVDEYINKECTEFIN